MIQIVFSFCLLACTTESKEISYELEEGKLSRQKEMISESIQKSKTYTLAILEQMPDSLMGYRPTEEVMSFSQHFRHNAFFTCNQLANRLGFESPYKDYRPAVDLNKENLLVEVNRMYDFMAFVLSDLDEDRLMQEIEFGEDMVPVWKLFDIMENHIIHHRGACIVYLRMNGIVPKGYFGY